MEDVKQNSGKVNEDLKPVKEPVVKTEKSPKRVVVVLLTILVIGLGVITGYFLSNKLMKEGKTGTVGVISEVVKGKEYGMVDVSGKDTAMGVVEVGGLNGEGTHKLLREGGPSQTVYLTSSAVDLDLFNGKKVQIWGETFRGQKTGWFMDVLKIKPLE